MSARIVKVAVAAAGLFLSATGSARASVVTTTTVVHGTSCVGLSSTDEARLVRNGFGPYT
jgi:hypothetical protein